MKKLTLSLKKKWFEMISSGKKTEEYRELKQYWVHRLMFHCDGNLYFKKYDIVTFTLGYPKISDHSRRISFKIKDIEIGEGKQEWGAEVGKKYFIITFDERISE